MHCVDPFLYMVIYLFSYRAPVIEVPMCYKMYRTWHLQMDREETNRTTCYDFEGLLNSYYLDKNVVNILPCYKLMMVHSTLKLDKEEKDLKNCYEVVIKRRCPPGYILEGNEFCHYAPRIITTSKTVGRHSVTCIEHAQVT
jgi:hypothetical protein